MPTPQRSSILLVHDARSRACDGLRALLDEFASDATWSGQPEEGVQVAVSAQSAAEALREGNGAWRVVFVCLDLQPAPRAGSRIAEFAVAQGIPVVLVTRSARWIPEGSALQSVPWVPPDATLEQVEDAIDRAIEGATEITLDGEDTELDRVSIGF